MPGSYRTDPAPSALHARSGGADLRRHAVLEGLEVLVEHARELRRLCIVGGAVGPRAARLEDVGWNVGTAGGYGDVEDWIGVVGNVVERAGECRANHRSGVADLHSLADAVRAAG